MTFNIVTIGCQMNISDAERIASYLESAGYIFVDDKYSADLIVLVSCGVRQSAENRIYSIIKNIREHNRHARILLTGCLALRDDVRKRVANDIVLMFPVDQLSSLDLSPGHTLESSAMDLSGSNEYLRIQPQYSSSFSAFVPIGNGCNNFCSYCVVPYARGREIYRPAGEILQEVRTLIKKGYKEITLIAQNVNSYRSAGVDFSELLKRVDSIRGDFWIRFSTSHPKNLSGSLMRVIKNGKKICHHLHMAVQSGDNEILRAMNRKYSIETYQKLIDKLRAMVPDIAITTDVIVGFPGETKRQFSNTAKLFRTMKYDMAYIASYSPRPGTVAETMTDNVSKLEKRKREIEINTILKKTALANNKKYLGKTIRVLVDSKNKAGEWIGKDEHFKNVIFHSADKNLIGQFVNIKINHVKDFGLYG